MAEELITIKVSKCGGTSEEEAADEQVQEILTGLKSEIEKKLGYALDELTAITYKSQVVAGRNFFIKAHIGNEKYIHVRIYRHFSSTTELHGLQENKTKDEAVEYF